MAAQAIVEFRLTEEDHLAFNYYHHLVHDTAAYRRYLRIYWILFVIFFVEFFVLGFFGAWNFSDSWLLLVTVLAAVYFLLAVCAKPRFRRSIRKQVRKLLAKGDNSLYLSTQWLTLSPDGVLQATETGESRRAWGGIKAVVEQPQHLFIYFSGIQAFIVPRRVFPDEFAYEDFVTTARSYFEAAHKSVHQET